MDLQAEMAFQGRWRDYQQDVLDALPTDLGDGKLHVVAAPGSGKTVLGLEVMRRIGRPAIVLAPTVAIRNQWVDRLCALFLPSPHAQPEWLSTSLAAPAFLTVSTYQALDAAIDQAAERKSADAGGAAAGAGRGPCRLDSLVAFFSAHGPVTLMLDEAHHLRREWWRALTRLQDALPGAQIVSLTATPPYDVEYSEWLNYETLCGPVDQEISVPQLVRNGDLCPHQDYLHVSLPVAPEEALLSARLSGFEDFIIRLHDDAEFLGIVLAHPWMIDPSACEEQVLEDPEFFSAMLVFARFAGARPPRGALKLLGVGASEIPAMSLGWMEILLNGMLFTHADGFPHAEHGLAAIRAELGRLDAIEGGRVRLLEDKLFYTILAGSLAKIAGIVAIARAEAGNMGEDLRMVVLADHVCAADMPTHGGDRFQPSKLGVVPIFEAVRREAIAGTRLGILTGSLVVVPGSALSDLERAAQEVGIGRDDFRAVPLAHDPAYLRIDVTGESANRIVQLVTKLFDAGEVNLLVGTQALLGEGWDAPTANTLVLASYVGSYMLSNQMRGRAIRIDPFRPAKAANIWHLATISPDTLGDSLSRRFDWAWQMDPADPIGRALGPDMEMLKRRFLAFEGVTHDGPPRIEGGLWRLGLEGRDWTAAGIEALNGEMLTRASHRGGLEGRWRNALGDGSEHRRMRQIVRASHVPRLVPFADTLLYLAITGMLGGAASAANAMRGENPGPGLACLLLFLGLTSFYALPKLGKALYLLARNGTLEGDIGQVGRAVIEGLDHAGLLAGPPATMTLHARRSPLGKCLIQVEGVSRSDERMILDAMGEVLGPVANPRYLIVRPSMLGRWLRIDYHAVPDAVGRNKADADYFAARWNRHVGRGRLVYLRSAKGRRILLRARARSLAAGFQRSVDRLSVWQ